VRERENKKQATEEAESNIWCVYVCVLGCVSSAQFSESFAQAELFSWLANKQIIKIHTIFSQTAAYIFN